MIIQHTWCFNNIHENWDIYMIFSLFLEATHPPRNGVVKNHIQCSRKIWHNDGELKTAPCCISTSILCWIVKYWIIVIDWLPLPWMGFEELQLALPIQCNIILRLTGKSFPWFTYFRVLYFFWTIQNAPFSQLFICEDKLWFRIVTMSKHKH